MRRPFGSRRRNWGRGSNASGAVQTDLEFIARIAPLGGLDFRHEKLVDTGTGYEACLLVCGYPKTVSSYWLTLLTGIEDTICVLDLAATSKAEMKRNLRRSLEEQNSRYRTARTDGDALDAQQQYAELEEMYREVSAYGDVMKSLLARIYVFGATMYEVDQKLHAITQDLEGSGFQCQVCLNETRSDWRNAFLSYSQQQESPYRRTGQPVLARALAGGNPFHFSELNDPQGMYFGVTRTGGAVLFDLFRKTHIRLSYDFVVVGKKGSGKSTALKKIMLDRAQRGDLVRVFDVTGEFASLTRALGGTVVSLDGQTENRINLLQILPGESPGAAYHKHISKVAVIWRYLKGGQVSETELLMLKQVLRLLYIRTGFCDEAGRLVRDLDAADPEDFPILEDLLHLVQELLQEAVSQEWVQGQTETIRDNQLPALEDLELKLQDLCRTYGALFNGPTMVRDFYREKVVCFHMRNLAEMEEAIYDAQLYNALSLCWENCREAGADMKARYEAGTIAEADLIHSVILLDEAHKTINAGKAAGVEEVMSLIREGRKYFTAIGLASQSIRDFVPDYVGEEAVAKMRTLFELTTYKFIMNQDSNALPKLKEVFQTSFSEGELQRIPLLGQGECLFSISGDRNLDCSIDASDEELALFEGGR